MAQTQLQGPSRKVSSKPTQLYRLGRTAAAHPWAFIVGWIIVFAAAALLLPRLLQMLRSFVMTAQQPERR